MEWIDVNDRMPPEQPGNNGRSRVVLVAFTVPSGARRVDIDQYRPAPRLWCVRYGWEKVTHWQEMPAPPTAPQA